MENRICICGAGTMGSGIAQIAAASGIHTLLFDLSQSALEKAKKSIGESLDRRVSKKRITEEEKIRIVDRLAYSKHPGDCLSGFIIEAVVEKPEAKIALFNQLAEINHSETVFATNTSSLSVTHIAGRIKNPERVIGMHFFNPAPVMKLVEVVTTELTNPSTIEKTMQLARQLGKIPVVCRDAPGFIVNRVARPYYIESLRMVEEGVAGIATVDRLLEATGFKMGPFRLMDLIGNDVNYAVSCSVYDQLGQPERLKPSRLQKEKVDTGLLGKKTGQGYYTYNP